MNRSTLNRSLLREFPVEIISNSRIGKKKNRNITDIFNTLQKMLFEKISLNDTWNDYSVQTSLEESMKSVEQILLKFEKSSLIKKSDIFFLNKEKYKIRYYPINYNKNQQVKFYNNPFISCYNTIRYMFHITTSFVLITGVKNEDPSDLYSTVSSIIQSIDFLYPIFIRIPPKFTKTFIGILHNKNTYIHYNSHTLWDLPLNYHISKNALNLFSTTFSTSTHPIISKRYYSTICDFSTEHIINKFYCIISTDPVHQIQIFSHFPPQYSLPLNSNITFLKANFSLKCSHRTLLHAFLKHFQQISNQNSFQRCADIDIINTCSTTISKLFQNGTQKSILLLFIIKCIKLKSELYFSELWMQFCCEMRKYSEKHLNIPTIESTKPNFGKCLIQQKLEVINYCNSNQKELCISFDDFQTLIQLYEASNDENTGCKIKQYNNETLKYKTAKEFSESLNVDLKLSEKIFSLKNSNFQLDEELQRELALDYLERMSPIEVFSQLIPLAFDHIIEKVKSKTCFKSNVAKESFDAILKLKQNTNFESINSCLDLCRCIEKNVHAIEVVNSFAKKFNDNFDVIDTLMKNKEMRLEGMSTKNVMKMLLNEEEIIGISEERNDYIITDEINGGSCYMFLSQESNDEYERCIVATSLEEKVM